MWMVVDLGWFVVGGRVPGKIFHYVECFTRKDFNCFPLKCLSPSIVSHVLAAFGPLRKTTPHI